MRISVALIVFLIVSTLVSAQDLCQNITDKKALKYYKEGIDKKKNKKDARMEALQNALELEPYFVAANCRYGRELARTLNYEKASFNPCEKYFQVVVDSCPNYHSDPYYYLGIIAYENGEYVKATDFYKKFMNFQSDNDDAYARDYDRKHEQAKSDYKWARFYAFHQDKDVPYNPVIVEGPSMEHDEYLPLISPDNERMYITQRLKIKQEIQRSVAERDDIMNTELFVFCRRGEGGGFQKPELMPKPFNMDPEANYGGASISIDNKHLFFTICAEGKMGYTNCDIYQTDLVYGFNDITEVREWHWTELRNLGPNINTEDGWESQPTISADGKMLYFASYRKDSRGIDIYFSKRLPDGSWDVAENLGEPINTEYNDKSPFMHTDSETLYFSSDGQMGFGKYDVFFARKDNDGNWQEPMNIGTPINNEGDQHGFVVSTDGKTVYFGSNLIKEGGKGGYDIVSFELYEAARPERVVFLKGNVRDEHGNVVKDASIEMKNVETDMITSFDVDTVDGSYAAVVTLKKDQDVIVSVKAQDKVFNSHYFKSDDTITNTFKELELELEHIHPGKPFTLYDIYFDHASAELTKPSKSMLDEFAKYLKEHPNLVIAIYGHTDNNGESESNLHLSTDRAFSVLSYLQEDGITKERMSFKGFGETKPVAPNNTAENRAKNRRTEFMIVSN
ncbi:MAG: OmpA family protein [Flavobacteriales bacterium]|nr:OmpA family protein [Flavobacteriales bacterium]